MTAAADETPPQLELDPRLAPGATFGAYRLGRLIGSGGMSSVHEGVHVALQKRIAIKILHANLAANDALRARFVREGEATSRIRHPNVVNVSDVGTHDGLPYLVMDVLDGQSLQQVLDVQGTLDERTLANVIVPVIAGLGAAHDAGVLHRDLKPDNIVLARETDGTIVPKLIDFGVSKLLDVSHGTTAAGSVLGTPHYMAPEVILQRTELDPRADQYAIGVLLYECLCGQVPFDAGSLFELMNLIVSGVYVRPNVYRPGLTPALEAIVVRAMATEPADRFPTLKALGAALLPFASTRTRLQYGPAFGIQDGSDPSDENLANTGQFAIARLVSSNDDPHGVTRAVGLSPTPSRAHTPLHMQLPPMAPLPSRPPAAEGDSGRRAIGFMSLAAISSVALGLFFAFGTTRPTEVATTPVTFTVEVSPTPADAIVTIDGAIVGRGPFRAAYPVDGRTHQLRVEAEGYVPHTSVFRDVAPEAAIVLAAIPSAPAPAVGAPVVASVPPAPVEQRASVGRTPSMRVGDRREPEPTMQAASPANPLDIRFER